MSVNQRGAMQATHGAVLALVDRIYEATLHPEGWPAVLTRAADLLGATSGSLIVQHNSHGGGVEVESHISRLDSRTLLEYSQHWAPLDLGRQAMEELPAGALATDESVANRDDYRRSAIYNEFLLPRQIARVLAGLPLKDDKGLAHVFFHRPARKDPFGRRETELLGQLLPHLSRALTVRRHLFEAADARQATMAALDRLTVGVVLLGADGRVSHLNQAAASIVAERDGLSVARNRLCAALPAETRALLQRVLEATAGRNGRAATGGGALRLSRPSSRRPLLAVVTPLRLHSEVPSLGGPVAAVFVNDPERAPMPPPELLRDLWGLTPAEARVASHLASGLSLKETAQRLEVALETARTQLKRVLQKTDTRRQAELVALVARSILQPRDC